VPIYGRFYNLCPSKDDAHRGDGITEDIITQLSGTSGIQVVSRVSVMKATGAPIWILEIGAELGVATILEGSVRRDGARIRIVRQLIDARSDRHLWAETHDRAFKDLFAIQSDVARGIATA
jgi:TolB-like protein